MIDDIYRTIFANWQEFGIPKTLPREIKLETGKNKFVQKTTILTGFRRTGKTFILFELINRLLGTIPKKDILYLNFEDERIPKKTEFLSDLIPAYQIFFGQKPKYLLLDEIQTMPKWSIWLRRMMDTQGLEIFVTGSSSKLSSYEIPTEMRGRTWEKTVHPLTFNEYLKFKNIESANENEKKFYFNDYLLWGGLPEIVLLEKEKRVETLQNYFDTSVKRDMIERYSVKKEELLKTLIRLLINSTSMTVSRLYNNLKSIGFSSGKDTIVRYLSYISSAYFMSFLNYYSPKLINQLMYPRKVYCIDNGFITSLSTKFSKNIGHLFENWTYQSLKKTHSEIYYLKTKTGKEVDFAIMENNQPVRLIQACYDMSNFETAGREVNSLLQSGEKLGVKNLEIITLNKPGFPLPSQIRILSPFDLFPSL